MPKPDKKASYGEQKRITEKEKYRVLAEVQYFVKKAEKLRAIPDQLDEETQISPNTRAALNSIADELEELNVVWKEYSTAYLNVNRTERDEREKERETMKKLLAGFDKITNQMKAYENDPVAERAEFAECYAEVQNYAGHYHEMTNGTLVVPEMTEEQKSKMITVKKDIIIANESSLYYMKNLVDSGGYVTSEMGYVDQFDTPLFSHEPTPDDIMQGKLGDCYFVAALSSVAANNPQIIRDMIKDNGDGTVTVRLYEEKDDGALEPMYINVEKSVPVIKLNKADGSQRVEDINAVGTLWVQMFEKAFAAANIHYYNKQVKFSETERSYTDIEAGFGQKALRVLLGRQNIKNEDIIIRNQYSETDNPKVMDKLYEKIKQNVVDRHFMTALGGSKYMDKKLLEEYNKEFDDAMKKKENSGKNLTEKELTALRKDVARKVFCGAVVLFDEKTGVPEIAPHVYTLTNAYEKDGEKYVVVRNPHARFGYEKHNESKESDQGYCEIPLKKFAGIFPLTHATKLLEPKYYEDFSSEYHSPISKLYQGFLDSRSWKAKASFGMSLSKESSDLKRVLQKIDNIQKEKVPSKHSLMEAYKELDQAAKAYIEKHQNDNMAEMKDFTNRRLTIARACSALSGSFLGHLEKERDVQADIHRIGRMMVTDRGVYVTQRVSKGEQVHPDAKGIFTDARVSNALIPVAGDKLFDIALTEHVHEIPSKVLEEVAKAANEKQTESVEQNAAVVENANNIML